MTDDDREELDGLRRENQELYARLAALREPRDLIRIAAGAARVSRSTTAARSRACARPAGRSTGSVPAWCTCTSSATTATGTRSFGQVTPFAIGMRLPVAGYRVGALEEILGGSDTLAPPGRAAELADIIARLLDDPDRLHRLENANAARAERLFSIEAMVDAYERIYAEALG